MTRLVCSVYKNGKTRDWCTRIYRHLAVTGNVGVFLQNALEWGFDDVVTKPFGMKTLLPSMQSCIEAKHNGVYGGNNVYADTWRI